MTRSRVVVVGLGDTGVLTAVRLARHADVVAVGTKPGLLSGQELGLRLARPERWARDYRIGFDRLRGLDRVRLLHGRAVSLDVAGRTVTVETAGKLRDEPYDVLVVATGVSNGFWRDDLVLTDAEVDARLATAHQRLAGAATVAVVGGGAAAVSSAAQLAARWPAKQVDLYFPAERALQQHHPRVWRTVAGRLTRLGVGLHPGHRAALPSTYDEIGGGPVSWTTGQPPSAADAVLWTVGRTRPHTTWLPPALLDADGFVEVSPRLEVPGAAGVFAVGDVAATDPLRTSARNRADRLVARNVRAHLAGQRLRSYRPPRGRWGSVLGPQDDGLVVFAPDGRGFRFPRWTVDSVLQPWIVRWGIYLGVRRER